MKHGNGLCLWTLSKHGWIVCHMLHTKVAYHNGFKLEGIHPMCSYLIWVFTLSPLSFHKLVLIGLFWFQEGCHISSISYVSNGITRLDVVCLTGLIVFKSFYMHTWYCSSHLLCSWNYFHLCFFGWVTQDSKGKSPEVAICLQTPFNNGWWIFTEIPTSYFTKCST